MAWNNITILLASFLASWTVGCSGPTPAVETHAMKYVRCLPESGRKDQEGCWLLATHPVAEPAGNALYWHIYEFPTARLATEAKDPHSEIIEAYGQNYLMAVTTAQWTPRGGRRVAVIGPMETVLPVAHTATFLQTWLVPGMQTRVHRHEGPEALLILSGEQCVETPDGASPAREGEQYIVRAHTPMVLYAKGSGRRALAIIIHPSDQPLSHAHEWQPQGLCLKN